jgi:hypothetical protein
MLRRSCLSLLAVAPLGAGCTVIEVDSRRDPAGLEANGLLDGHIAFGLSGETTPLRLQVLDGQSPGAFFELTIWKLFRLELGLAGIDIGLGPVDAGLGVIFYDPALPPRPPRKPKEPPTPPPSPMPVAPPSEPLGSPTPRG